MHRNSVALSLAALMAIPVLHGRSDVAIRETSRDGWNTVEIENSIYKVVLIPDIARLPYSLVYKPTGHDFFHHPKPLTTPKKDRRFVYYGGLIDSIPWVSGKVDGKRLATKGYLHFSPWTWETGAADGSVWWEGSTSFEFADPVSGVPTRLFFKKRITGYASSARLDMDYEIRNDGDDIARFALAAHARTKIAGYDEHDYFHAPGRMCQVYAMNNMDSLEARGIRRFDWTAWPLAEATDLMPGQKGKSIFAYVPSSWCAVGDAAVKASLVFVGSPIRAGGRTDVMKMGIFMSHGAGAYVVEPCVSYSLEGSPEVWQRPGATVDLDPGESCTFTLSMVPYHDLARGAVEAVHRALPDGLLLDPPRMEVKGRHIALRGRLHLATAGRLLVTSGMREVAARDVEPGLFDLSTLGNIAHEENEMTAVSLVSAAGTQQLAELGSAAAVENRQRIVPDNRMFDGEKLFAAVPLDEDMNLHRQLTVEAWVKGEEQRPEVLQALVSQWAPLDTLNTFDAYDAGHTSGLDTTGFLGAVFDGRYVYFSPQHGREDRQGVALRYDTHGAFKDAASWLGFDAGHIDGLNTKGYYGAIFDGRYVVYVPRRSPEAYHTRTLRYDTREAFDDPAAWEAYDVGLPMSCQSGAFDGRYIYFAPGTSKERGKESRVIRFDTQGPFKAESSWRVFDADKTAGLKTKDFDGALFDGRYVYFAPLSYGAPLRYDTTLPFDDASSWSAFDATPLGMERCVGLVFDGRHLYFCSYNTPGIVRYDVRAPFDNAASWSAFDVHAIPGLTWEGYDGGFFDGRYVYFVPFLDQSTGIEGQRLMFHAELVRYDTQGAFDDPASWQMKDVGDTDGLNTVGYNAGAYDGRYFYCAPWHDGEAYHGSGKIVGHGRVLRYDGVGNRATFSLRYCDIGHNGGLNGAVPGPRFIVNTDKGARSVAAYKALAPGWHHLVGVFTGEKMQLFVDGALANERAADGTLVQTDMEVTLARIQGGLGYFKGTIDEVNLFDVAKSATWVRERHDELKARLTASGLE